MTSPRTTLDHIVKDWKEIVKVANDILQEREKYLNKAKVPLGGNKRSSVAKSKYLMVVEYTSKIQMKSKTV